MKKAEEQELRFVQSASQKTGQAVIGILLVLTGMLCFVPFWYIVCQSFSSNEAISAGKVGLLPVEFQLDSYLYVLKRAPFWKAAWITVLRVAVGLPLGMFLMVTAAYPLSKGKRFPGRDFYVWFIFFTMLFHGGLIPTYLVVRELGLLNTVWAMILPCAVNVFNMLLVLSFFRQLPVELEESASLDGAGHWRILWSIFLPVSKPVLATVALFTLVQHWNSWFDGMIYMKADRYPLQTYLRSIIISFNFSNLTPLEQMQLSNFNENALKSAQMVIGTIPILLVYPFLQRYFVSGITLGSVKG
ncbi:MAG: carbohydrate ABC transporter permease [Lachnospiraceae bacterium]|jgi:putative aldouronate transport system permease protein|nr:carbohydrate ABC transporter permease [uncultured Schaedlerella sp.]MCI8896698.1 carbohydrate ABC transporter permease [Lachnospiraceae bacterium]